MTKNRINHTGHNHPATTAARQACKKATAAVTPVAPVFDYLAAWSAISTTDAAHKIGSSEFHYVGSAEDNADDTMVERYGDDARAHLFTQEWAEIAIGSYDSLKDSNFYAEYDQD